MINKGWSNVTSIYVAQTKCNPIQAMTVNHVKVIPSVLLPVWPNVPNLCQNLPWVGVLVDN